MLSLSPTYADAALTFLECQFGHAMACDSLSEEQVTFKYKAYVMMASDIKYHRMPWLVSRLGVNRAMELSQIISLPVNSLN